MNILPWQKLREGQAVECIPLPGMRMPQLSLQNKYLVMQ